MNDFKRRLERLEEHFNTRRIATLELVIRSLDDPEADEQLKLCDPESPIFVLLRQTMEEYERHCRKQQLAQFIPGDVSAPN